MQEDSINSTTSERTTQNQVITASSSTSFQCSHCTLLFKTKVYLFEHLHKVHGFDIDVAIREAGVKHPGTNRADTQNSLGDGFECQRCDSTACDCDVLNEHERQCHKKPEDRPVIRNLVICENPETIITVTSTNQGTKAAGAKEIMSTSKSKCTLNSSKDLKTYKRPLQTITKFFAVSSHSNEKPPVKSAESPKLQDATKGTIILQESPSSSAPNSSGVFKVTAKSTIDITRVTNRFLLNDHLLNTDLRPPKPKERSKETVPDGVETKTNTDGSKIPPLKKAKLENKDTNLPNAAERQLSGNTEFSFDISEDEGEKRLNLVSEDPESSKVYFCKHCEYSGAGITCLSMHYQNHHPYVRYNAAYIQDPSDDSSTFRCLHCPVEFVSVADLKRHYTDTHPEAPDVFTMQSRELGLAFKCFTCLFTTSVLKALKKHYKEIHPTHNVDNSLMYYRYSVTGSQEGSAGLNACEKGQSPERRGEISPETACSPCEVVNNMPSPQHPTSTGADVSLYHCNNCKFSHKSVVVMHVHYQKSHPGEEVTIDKIRQSACVTSQMTPDKSPNSATVTKTPAPQTDISDPPKKTKAEPLQHERTSEGSKTRSESSKAEPAEDSCKSRKSPIKRKREESARMNSLSCGSPNGLFYCQYCNYSSVNIKSVVGHHNAKHALHALTCMEEIAVYSAKVGKRKCQSEAGPSASTTSSHSKTRKQVEVDREEVQQDEAEDASSAEGNAYARAENLFYCQMCNYGNPSVKGVANHQTRIHKTLHYSKENIVKHTYLMCKEIKKSKSQPKELSFATRLPLPLMNEGDVDMFFCYFCNYRQSTVEYVSRHCLKKHRGFLVKGDQIRLYTNMVREKTQKSRLKTTSKLEVNHASLKRKGIKTKNKQLGKSLSVSAAHSVTASQPQRALQCYRCTYTTQYVYLLRRHVWKTHRANRSISDVLRVCFKQGDIQAGFHCDLCVFSHKKALGLHEHYQEQHPGRRPSLEYVMTRLYVGPNMCSLKRKRPQTKCTDAIAATAADGSSPSQRSGQNETKTYSCRACSFKSGSVSAITHHYRAVHPWSVKEDGSVLGVVNSKRPSVNRQVEEDDDDGSFESYQVPLEFDTPASSTMLYCPYCPASFHTQHGLNTHCGMKHHEEVNKDLDKQENGQSETRMHVFKCPHCSYVNTSYQGVLTHCHMKHPTLESSVYSHHVDEAQLTNWGGLHKSKSPGNPGNLKIRGYMCESCPQLCVTLEKLNKHCKKAHSESVTNTAPTAMKAAPEPSAGSKIKQHKTLSNWGAASQASFLNRKMIKCQYCPFSCRTKIALDRHVRVDHKKASVSKLQDCMYKCVLCSSSYFTKIRLGSHYVKKHGRDSFLKYYAPVYKQAQEKPASHDGPEQPEDTHEAAAAKEKETLLVYRCPTCSYVNTSYHGTLTHCQMKHPDLIARADELQTEEVLETNMVGCTIGKGHNQRGYTCKICPLIYPSVKKLKIHCEKFHNVISAVSASKTTLEKCQSDSLPTEKKETLYQCHICHYATLRRRYLQCHLKKTHRLDALTTHNLLQKYNKRNRRPPEADMALSAAEGSAAIQCKKCPELKFDSSQLLVDHYSAFHSSNAILDFAVLSQGKKKGSTGLYRCNHCNKQMNGIRKLCNHLDHHRERAKKRAESYRAIASLEAQSIELCKQEELLTLERAEDVSQWNVTSAQTFSLPPSPLSSSSKPTDAEQPQPEPRDVKHACKQCRRTFMSLKGLRSHERSHAAVAALKLSSLPATVLKHSINKYVLYKAGTIRPFLCSICSYRTAVMGLMRSHLRKVHQNAIMDLAESDNMDEENVPGADMELFNASEQFNNWPELDKESEITEKSLYLEPPDVQRQLSHYNLMAQANSPSKRNVSDTKLPENCLLHCEFCNFNTGHLSSVRRHYLNRHGKKFLRCKDCEFFTGSRKTMEMHMEAGHSTCQSEPTHQKDLRCPLCLYQTKNKNNMIDHIVLHREERVVPIEVRRPKLSRYLQGIVFRCHQCTFSSGSADNLRSHMARHDDIKPYKCRLCYFDCTRLSDLEAHLSDKHQVLRNHELVGQVSLDELDARVGRRPEEEPPSNMEHHHNDGKDVETEEFVNDCDVVSHETQAKDLNTRGEIARQPKEAYLKRGQCDKNEESSVKSSLFDLWREDAKPNAAVQAKHECDPEEPAEMVFLPARPKVSDGEDSGITLAPPKEKAAEGSPITFGEIAGRKQAHKLQKTLQYRTMDIDARLEDDLLRDIRLLDEDVGVHKRHKKANHRTEKDIETKVGDHVRSEMTSRGKNQVNAKTISAPAMKNQMHVNNSGPQVEGQSQTLSSKCAKLKMSHEESLDVSFTNCKKEQLQNSKHSEEREPYGEMPVLENEYLKEEMEPVVCCKEEDLSDHFEQKQDKEGEAITKDGGTDQKHKEGNRMNEAGNPHVPKGALAATDGAPEAPCPAAAEDKPFTCEFCGRNLVSSSELTRHIMRHGL